MYYCLSLIGTFCVGKIGRPFIFKIFRAPVVYMSLYMMHGSISYLWLSFLFVKTDWVCYVWYNIYLGYTCRTTVICGALKDDSLLINILASNHCFSHRNIFKLESTLCQKWLFHFFPQKAQNFV